jgi:hypothetical protein
LAHTSGVSYAVVSIIELCSNTYETRHVVE